ncbi:MAG: PINc/VapC family ATPase [Candidatus Thermoplasmatota archaeon]
MKIVPDTSVIVDGRVTCKVENDGEIGIAEVIITESVLSELEAQANRGQETGMSGLEEIQKLKQMDNEKKIKLSFKGERPTYSQIKLSSSGEIDAMIRQTALEENAVLMTSDIVQAEIAKAKGIKVEYLKPEEVKKETAKEIWDYFKENVMSVHLKEGTIPQAKTGKPGNIVMEKIDEKPITNTEIRHLAQEIVETARRSSEGFIEYDKSGGTVVQLKELRIVISQPPFSDGFEITAVRAIAHLSLDDYDLSDELKDRIGEKRRGVLIAGAPGAGKSTLAQAVAEYLLEKKYVVKTMEQPRDLQVPDEITQYSSLDGEIENTADLLLLVRPDYTIFDEVRKTPHFRVFADMRLAGVGMIGVTHANRAIDALQRLIGRVELGMVPQVVDTIIFLEEAEVKKVYEIKYVVKVPFGMSEEDLARPVIEVKDFDNKKTEYEIYTFGEQVVVMPIEGEVLLKHRKPLWNLALKQIKYEIKKYVRGSVEVEIKSDNKATVFVDDNEIPHLLGKRGGTITRIEKDLGIHIDVKSRFGKKHKVDKEKIDIDVFYEGDKIVLSLGMGKVGENVDIYADDTYVTTATVGQDGSINIRRKTKAGSKISEMLDRGKNLSAI